MLLVKVIEKFISYLRNSDKAEETVKGYTIELKVFYRFLAEKYNGPVYIEEISIQDIEEYIELLKKNGKAPASRNRSIYIIRAFYEFCFKKEYISKNISLNLIPISVPTKERIYLTGDEMKELISAVKHPTVKLMLRTLFFTGMRISECVNLQLQDVDLKNRVITVKNTKNKRDRQIPIHKELVPILTDYLNNWRNGKLCTYFFASNKRNRVSPDYINRILHETTQELNWEKKVTCHIIRHSFASNLVSKNVNIVKIQKLLGHTDLSTTSIYTHTNIPELEDAVNLI